MNFLDTPPRLTKYSVDDNYTRSYLDDFTEGKESQDTQKNITQDFIDWVYKQKIAKSQTRKQKQSSAQNIANNKVKQAIEYITEKQIDIYYKKEHTDTNILREIKLIYTQRNAHKEYGYFYIKQNKQLADTLTISIFLEKNMMHNQLSRLMIAALCFVFIQETKIHPDTLIYIDADVSKGFWDKIGMKQTRKNRSTNAKHSNRTRQTQGEGMEKSISFSDLCKWALGIPGGTPNSGADITTIMKGGIHKGKRNTKKRRLTKRPRTTLRNKK